MGALKYTIYLYTLLIISTFLHPGITTQICVYSQLTGLSEEGGITAGYRHDQLNVRWYDRLCLVVWKWSCQRAKRLSTELTDTFVAHIKWYIDRTCSPPPPLPDRQHLSLSAEPCLDGFHTHCRFDALVSCLRVKLIQKINQSYEQMCLYVSAPASWSYYRSWRESFFIIVVPSYIHTALDREEKQLSWTNGWMMWTRYRRLL